MNIVHTAGVAVALIALTTACAGSRVASTPTASSPSLAATQTAAPPPPVSAQIAVTLTDTMRIEPRSMTVTAGKPVTFVVTNTGVIPHEFTIGDGDVQDEHEREMMEMGGMGMTHDEDNAIAVAPGETKQLTYTFDMPGKSLAGCHVPGHYPAGMMATITVTA